MYTLVDPDAPALFAPTIAAGSIDAVANTTPATARKTLL
jgi:hypothetical protein